MGAQTRESLEAVAQHASSAKGHTVAHVAGLFQAGRALAAHPSLLAALADHGHDASQRSTLLDGALGSLDKASRELLDHVVGLGWSAPADLLKGIEEYGIRLSAGLTDTDVLVSHLLQLSRTIRGHAELQLALSDKRASAESKRSIVTALGAKSMDKVALEVAAHVASQPRGRRSSDALIDAARLVCAEDGRGLAEVSVATELSAAQLKTVQQTVVKRFGTECYLDVVIAPEIIGGARIQVGDVVIDGSVDTQLNAMRLQLAG